jgi:hypothetical protein
LVIQVYLTASIISCMSSIATSVSFGLAVSKSQSRFGKVILSPITNYQIINCANSSILIILQLRRRGHNKVRCQNYFFIIEFAIDYHLTACLVLARSQFYEGKIIRCLLRNLLIEKFSLQFIFKNYRLLLMATFRYTVYADENVDTPSRIASALMRSCLLHLF